MKNSWRTIAMILVFGLSVALLPFVGLPYEKLDTSAFYINSYTPTPTTTATPTATATATATMAPGVPPTATATPVQPTGPEFISFFGRTKAGQGKWVWVGARINPSDLDLPVTYTWEADKQTTLTHTQTSSGWQSSNSFQTFSRGNRAWVRFRWTNSGSKIVRLTVSNAGGTVNGSRTIVVQEPPTVNITSSAGSEGQTGTKYTFTATVSPSNTNTPISYYWRATDHNRIYHPNINSRTDTISLTWSSTGRKTIHVWIWNGVGWVQDSFTLNIPIVPPTFDVTTESISSGPWNSASTWSTNSVPGAGDVVQINSGHTVDASSTIQITSLLNKGTLQTSGTNSLTINASSAISNTGSIVLGSDAAVRRTRACDGSSGLSPGALKIFGGQLLNDGLIGGPSLNGLNGGRGANVRIKTSGTIWNGSNGVIRAGDGGDGGTGGGQGGQVKLKGRPVDNLGLIQAGNGGDGTQCGGDGGPTFVLGQDTTNHSTGIINGGDGGNATGGASNARAGDGGETHVWGKYGGRGYLVNQAGGQIRAGDGGDGNGTPRAGCGGRLKLISLPSVYLYGQHRAGNAGTPAAGGRSCRNGRVIIEPVTIVFGSETSVSGGDILIYGDENSTIELRNLSENAIRATNGITLAVGAGGTIDLQGNDSQILNAGAGVAIYADNIEVEDDVPLGGLVGADVTTGSSRIVREVSLVAPDTVDAQRGETVSLTFEILNGSPNQDTFTLSASDQEGWNISISPTSITVDGLENKEFTVNVTVPSSRAVAVSNEIAITAVSQADGTVSGEGRVVVSTESSTLLPGLSIADAIASESGGTMTFTVNLSSASTLPVSVNYTTVSATATNADYTAASGVLTIPAGSTSGTVTVNITADDISEGSETFSVILSNPLNATIADGEAVGTITDLPPTALDLSDFNAQESKQWQMWLLLGMMLTSISAAMIWRNKRE